MGERVEQVGFEGPRAARGLIAVRVDNVPAAEDQVLGPGKSTKSLIGTGCEWVEWVSSASMVPRSASEPTGLAMPFLIASTPAMSVVLMAPSPPKSTPMRPGAALEGDQLWVTVASVM